MRHVPALLPVLFGDALAFLSSAFCTGLEKVLLFHLEQRRFPFQALFRRDFYRHAPVTLLIQR